jgi:DNA processing protein
MSAAELRLAFGGMHPDQVRSLLARFGTAQRAVNAIERGGLRVNDRVRAEVRVPAADRREQLVAFDTAYIRPGDAAYPDRLAVLPDAPQLLFVRGSMPAGPTVAVVGTRRCTAYGRRLATAYGVAIATAGWVLVSGLARGIDGAAHRGTVEAGGVGVVVLGCGIDVAYPREHAGLASRLVELGGAVITEYPPGTPPEAWRFPPRNHKNTPMNANGSGSA